ncbi:MAG: urate hydroxylase PuuD [Elusimicrobia bacterium]|nr:urate hydroxylase PuuD [Elusimicrobiota bacterium]
MDPVLSDWLSLLVRWVHVIAGIMWIGTTYLFNWMERTLTPPTGQGKENISGELWMVHGGGFYLVEKQKWPEIMPKVLHWFRWEAMTTWLSGMALLALVYWNGAPLLEYGSELSRAQGVAVSLGVLVLGLAVYHLLWRSPLAQVEPLGAAVSLVLVTALAWGLGRYLSDRAVYLHIGAMFGTIMVTNVWMIILPNQARMIAITKAGGTPDQRLAALAGRCSKHNTYMSVPLIFTMISNHYPATTFGTEYGWAVLAGVTLLGWGAAKLIRDVL